MGMVATTRSFSADTSVIASISQIEPSRVLFTIVTISSLENSIKARSSPGHNDEVYQATSVNLVGADLSCTSPMYRPGEHIDGPLADTSAVCQYIVRLRHGRLWSLKFIIVPLLHVFVHYKPKS